MQKGNVVTLIIAILGALKLVLEAAGYDIITDQNINDIANGIAALVTVVGVVINHFQHPKPDGTNGQNVVE